MLEIKSSTVDIKFNDKIYHLRKPYVDEVQLMSEADEKDSVKAIKVMLVTVGLPEDVCKKLEIPHMKALVKELTEEKK